MRRFAPCLFCFGALAACRSPGATVSADVAPSSNSNAAAASGDAAPMAVDAARPGHLVAKLDAGRSTFRSERDVRLTITVENRGTTPEEIDRDMLGTAIFAVDVIDASGRRVPTIPPGTPPQNYVPRRERLAPGAKRRIECQFTVFSPSLPPGTYRVRLRDRSFESDEILITIAP